MRNSYMSARAGFLGMIVGSALLAGCGSGGDEASDEAAATPKEAIVQIGAVRRGLDDALKTYAGGDAARADEQVGTTYLEHFELVEGPLEKADEELNEQLEESIREELRSMIKGKAPKSDVGALVAAIKADLSKAEAALR